MKSFNPLNWVLKPLRKWIQRKLLEHKKKKYEEIKEKRNFYHTALCSCLSNGNPKGKAGKIRGALRQLTKELKIAEKEYNKCLKECKKI